MVRLESHLRVTAGIAVLAFTTFVLIILLIVSLPFENLRAKMCNLYGKTVGRFIVTISGVSLDLQGVEHLDRTRPAIYISNHTSALDIFLAMWLSPLGTVGIAKRSVIWYPFIGQIYFLSGHLRIDRGNSPLAIQSLIRLAKRVRRKRLSIFIWPEGTRSRDGRLQPFKKGVVHLARQTGLPVVPVMVQGAHKSWEKTSLTVRRVRVRVRILPAIDTSDWSVDTLDEHLDSLRAPFLSWLPPEQRPLPLAG